MKSDFFAREIAMIEDRFLRTFTVWYLNNFVGEWFWKSGASSSGKHHPKFVQGEGGLVRHTKAVCMVCEELLRLNTYAYMKPIYKDYARVACLLHDTCKYGTSDCEDKDCFSNHGRLAADNVANKYYDYYGANCPDYLWSAINSHMGQWTQDREDRPFTTIDRLVHLSDYIASRDFFDIPCISEEYNKIKEEFLPF